MSHLGENRLRKLINIVEIKYNQQSTGVTWGEYEDALVSWTNYDPFYAA